MGFGDPQVIGRYTIRETLGAGGFATVYRAYDPVLDRQVALKVLHPHLSEEAETRERFIHEGRTLAGIHHRNIVQVFDAGTADGQVYLAMELVEGRSLAAMMRERDRTSVEEAVRIAEQAAAALDALHERGLIHCDVKPANILLERESGRAVLLDFGVSRRVDDTITVAAWIWGTPAYMAPEQIEPGQRISRRTDVYQLAATVYALLAGEPPFTGEPAQLMYAVVNREPPSLAAHRIDVSPPLAAIVAGAMAKDPAQRPDGPGMFAGLLREQIASEAEAAGAESQTQRITPPVLIPERSPWAAGARAPARPPSGTAAPPPLTTTERLERIRPEGGSAAPASGGRSHIRRTAVFGGLAAALILASAAGLAWMSNVRGGDTPDGSDDSFAGVVQEQTASATPTVTPTPTPQRSPTRTPTSTPGRPQSTPTPRPGSAGAEGVAGLMQQTMSRRGYTPSGPVVPVELSRNAVMYVQRGDGEDGQRLFIVVNDTYIGTDWEDASPEGVSNPRAIGQGRFLVTYSQEDGPPVPVVFTWTGDSLRPSSVAPGHCLPTTGC